MPSENILSHFWELASIDEKKRLKAASQLLHALNQAQKQHDERRKVSFSLTRKFKYMKANMFTWILFLVFGI